MQKFTDISWIGNVKQKGDEWSVLTKQFFLESKPQSSVIRLDAYGVVGIYINGEFVEGSTGRYPGRIVCVECTSKLRKGENEICLKLGNHYYENSAKKIKERRGSWFSAVAAELKIFGDEGEYIITTNESWKCVSDCGTENAKKFSDVTKEYYERFWKVAALWEEEKPIAIPNEIAEVVGEEYVSYVRAPRDPFAYPEYIYETNMEKQEDGILLGKEDCSYVGYDFGRLQVGYVEIEYEAEEDGRAKLRFEYTESKEELEKDNSITLRYPIQKGHHTLQVIHRRAGRYLRVQFDQGAGKLRLINVRFRLSMKPAEHVGWFQSSDDVLNQAWEVGKYTLWVNKHQEYESCPRNEMKFFSGDGIIAALIDYYVFGDSTLVDSSLALTEIDCNSGVQHNIYDRNSALWDYPAWYIIMAYNQYRYYKDKALIERYYEQMVLNLLWMIQKTNREGLIYQYPIFLAPFYSSSEAVEYTCSCDRLGEKPYMNALFYQSLLCMSELAEVMNDSRAKEWKTLATKVRKAFNERLWDEKIEAYVDTYDTSYVPQDGNALAVLFGLADKEKAEKAMKTLCRENWSPYGSAIASKALTHTRGGDIISPVICMYEAEARFQMEQGEKAIDLIRRCWGTMLEKGAGTFWEYAPNNGHERWPTPSHGWSAGCTYLLSAYVLGVRPLKAGYEELLFKPYDGSMEFSGVIPTAKGLVGVKCEIKEGVKVYHLCVPQDVQVKIEVSENVKVEMTVYKS